MANLNKLPSKSAPVATPVMAKPAWPSPAKAAAPKAVPVAKAIPPEAPAAPAVAEAPVVAKPRGTGPRPMARVITALGVSLVNAKKNAERISKLNTAGDDAAITDGLNTLRSTMAAALANLDTATDTANTLFQMGYDPARFGRGRGAAQGAGAWTPAVGEFIRIGAKARPTYAEFLTPAELDTLVVHSVTQAGKIVVQVDNTPKIVGVFRVKQLTQH